MKIKYINSLNNNPNPTKKIKIINIVLMIINVILASYLAFFPYIPKLLLKFNQSMDDTEGYKYQSKLVDIESAKENSKINQKKLKPIPDKNTLVIPEIGVDSEILEGPDSVTLDMGIWRRPNSSTPDQGGNTVLTGHRFMYTFGPHTFYSLDKLKEGSKILVFWDKKEYVYEVFNTKVVDPTDFSIEYNTDESIVTLFTCTPLWTSTNRLVVQAKKIEI